MQVIYQSDKEVLVKFESAEIQALSGQYDENLVYCFTLEQLESIKARINQALKQSSNQTKIK